MTEPNEVINAIHHCIADEDFIQRREGPSCAGCPYEDDPVCVATLKSDIQKLLKAQEPRVMRLEEVRDSLKQPIWKDTKSSNAHLYTGWVLAYDIQRGQGITGERLGMAEPSGRVVWYRLEDYGRTWRCWTSRPTDEQREAEPWNA